MLRGTLALPIAVGLAWLIATPSAGAASGIGATFTPLNGCGAATFIQTASPGGQYTVPTAGVITAGSFQASSPAPPQLKLKVARPAGGSNYAIVGESAVQSPAANTFVNFPAQIAVQAGDVIGLYVSGGLCSRGPLAGTYTNHVLAGDIPSGSPPMAFGGPFNFQLDISAILEPDCDEDGFGDETQDPDTSTCNAPVPKADGTLTIDANKGKVEKGRKVTLSGQLDVASNEGCEPNRSVEIQRRLKSEDDSKFATFTTVKTDATGNYSTKVKVKKTYFYRAVVAETEACDDETSNSQKVRVQKKKPAQEA